MKIPGNSVYYEYWMKMLKTVGGLLLIGVSLVYYRAHDFMYPKSSLDQKEEYLDDEDF